MCMFRMPRIYEGLYIHFLITRKRVTRLKSIHSILCIGRVVFKKCNSKVNILKDDCKSSNVSDERVDRGSSTRRSTQREYLRVIITTIFFNAQQNVSFKGHDKNRKDIGKLSDVNRRNLFELLHLRCVDIPWLASELPSQHKLHAQQTLASIRNEILEIIYCFVVERIN